VYNTELVKPEDVPRSVFDLTDPKWRGQVAIANPLFGTTATHAAALFELLGKEEASSYLLKLKSNGVYIGDSNSRVCEMVAQGDAKIAFTDTDDVNARRVAGRPVAAIYPDQGKEQIGTLVIPNTVALVAQASHPEDGKALIDFLLSPEVEAALATTQAVQIPVRDEVARPAATPSLGSIKTMDVEFGRVAEQMDDARAFIEEELLR
jgi:iron(III) transport system substrate-binding protein